MRGKGKIALVTGASRGIGLAIAEALSEDGYGLVLVDTVDQAKILEDVASTFKARGQAALAITANVADESSVTNMAEVAFTRFGRIDVLVNNAGILIPSPIVEITAKIWENVMDVNAKGTFFVTRTLLPSMRKNNYGRIINIASIGGKHGAPGQAHYSASKAAIMGFTRVLAQEVGKDGITANCICPGIIVTDMGRTNLKDQAEIEHWTSITALRRLGRPQDVAGPVCFLASDEAAFITGQSLNVCGGIVLS